MVPSSWRVGSTHHRHLARAANAHRAGWPWQLPTRAPTDPDVRTLAHPVPRPTDSPSTGGPRSYLIELRGHGDRASMCSPWFPRSGLPVDASLSSTGSSRASSPASTVLSKRYDSLPPIPPRFVAFAWRYLGVTRWFRSSADECTVEAWSWSPGSSSRDLTEETTGPPKFLGNLNCPFAMFQTDAGRTACTRPIQCSSVALGISKAKAPTKGLSTLNSMAFGLAIYASQCGLPQPHARLASGRWSGATGRAFHPQDSAERFQICFLHLILLSQASWHNEIDRRRWSCSGVSDGRRPFWLSCGFEDGRDCRRTIPSAIATTSIRPNIPVRTLEHLRQAQTHAPDIDAQFGKRQ